MQKYSKISLITFFICTITIFVYVCIALFVHDPLQIWHKPFLRKDLTYSTMRESALAYIRDYDFDSAIFGNSYSENTSSKRAGEILGGKFFNLSMTGSTTYEKKVLMDYLLKRKKIKQIVYVADVSYFDLRKESPHFAVSSYDFLYNDDKNDDYKIYLNHRYLPCSMFFSSSRKCLGAKIDIDKPYAWDNSEEHLSRFGGFENWLKHKDNGQIKDNFKRYLELKSEVITKEPDEEYKKGLKEFLDNYIFETVKNNPDTKFYIIDSPVSDIELGSMLKDELRNFKKYELFLKYLVNENLDNLEIYSFNDIDECTKIANYKDARHYKPEINYLILEAIAKKQHKITSKNVDNYLKTIYKKAQSVDFEGYLKKIKD